MRQDDAHLLDLSVVQVPRWNGEERLHIQLLAGQLLLVGTGSTVRDHQSVQGAERWTG